MSRSLVVPPAVVPILRSALINEVGDAASEISTVSSLAEREWHPQWFASHLDHFDTHRSLLDLVGWGESDGQTELEIDLDWHRAPLLNALINQLDLELDLMDVDPTIGGAARQRRRAEISARAIESFLADSGLPTARGM
jgi:hypothetical protein